MGDRRVDTNHPGDQNHHVQDRDEENLRLDLDDKQILEDFDQSRSALSFVSRESNEELYPSCDAGLLCLRIAAGAVVQGLIAKDYDQYRGKNVESG